VVVVTGQSNLEEPRGGNHTFDYDPPEVTEVRPKPYNADGQTVTILGRNLGEESLTLERPNVTLSVNNVSADEEAWELDLEKFTAEGLPFVTAVLGRDVVGVKGGNLTVGGVTGEVPEGAEMFVSTCLSDMWGLKGEFCLPCPEGGICGGTAVEPYSDFGWWRYEIVLSNTTNTTECRWPERRNATLRVSWCVAACAL
jgi:hypothetical protein